MSLAVMEYEGSRSLRALNRSLTTSGVGAMAESGSRPVLDFYSTSPSIARGYQLVIVEETTSAALATDVEHSGWVIGIFDELSRFVCTAQSSSKKTTFEQASKIDDAINTVSDIAWLRTNLEISMSEIASLFGVTRKAVYDWTNGARATNASYIASVKTMIEQELRAELRPYLRQFWNFDEAGGEALVDILKSGDVRRLATARGVLSTLSGPIGNYVAKIRSSLDETAVSHLHNHDEYRYL
ncbi:hypothetical protein CLU92_1807 [Janthinobacterium sp. 61]|uniref:hypothetical protein n=1 Tax=Janthinobacterium sp. 61 TaxID=2035209 RepID=UPI000C708FD5|nr:hypothetical protein [Janthinobacterium sp. 61]PKV44467.1 hypothetical protein CLU92_1807 [Janthinobacterium sp. 61]